MHPWGFSLLAFCIATMLTTSSAAQADGSLDRTLRWWERVRDREETERSRPVRQLGEYDDARVTAILLAEVSRAMTPAYQRTAVRALGAKARDGAVEVLTKVVDHSPDDFVLRNAAAQGLAQQGDAGVEVLTARLSALPADLTPQQHSMRKSLVMGLGHATSAKAYAALAKAASTGANRDRLEALRHLRAVPPQDQVTAARTQASQAKDVLLAAEGLRQLALHGAPVKEAILVLHRNAKGHESGAVHAALLEALACVLAPDVFAPLLEHAAFVDAEVDEGLGAVAERLREDVAFSRFLLERGLKDQDPRTRAVAIRLLAKTADPVAAAALLPLVRAKEPEVFAAAITTLSDRGDAAAVAALQDLLVSGSPGQRLEALRGLHRLRRDDPAWRQSLIGLLTDGKGELRVLALDLLADLGAAEGLTAAWADLDHAQWPRRAAAYDFCRRVRAVASVDKLIARVDAEHGRLREDVLDALEALTRRRYWTTERWQQWWPTVAAGFELPALDSDAPPRERPASDGKTTVSYYELPITSERCTFVVDVSGSMSVPFGTGNRTKLAEAQRQLQVVLEAMPAKTKFNVIFFATKVTSVFKGLTAAETKAKEQAGKAVKALVARGGTNVHEALELAFADTEVDTILLLSDGYPSHGRIKDPEALAAEVARWNLARRLRVHTIAVGDRSPLLARLAKDSGGTHTWIR